MSRPVLLSLLGSAIFGCLPTAARAAPEPTDLQQKADAAPDLNPAPSASQLDPYLNAQGLEYLKLRETLEQDTAQSAVLCQLWWTKNAHTATTPHKERVLALWAKVNPKACASAMGKVLLEAWSKLPPDSYVDCEQNQAHHERVCQSLRRLGAHAAPPFLELAASSKIPDSGRAIALEELARLAPAEWLVDIARRGLADPSDPALREPLERALLRRAHADTQAHASLSKDLKILLTQEKLAPTLALRLWKLLGAMSNKLDTGLYQDLARKVLDPQTEVPLRVVYARLLARAPQAKAPFHHALEQLYAQTQGPSATSIVLTQALKELSSADRTAFLNQHPTWLSQDPQLALLSWKDATLPESRRVQDAFLRTGLHSIWPEVQKGALDRIQAPCANANLRKVAALAGPQSRRGSSNRAVRRAATDALARCGGPYARRKLMRLADNEAVGAYDRGRALRRYIEQSPNNEKTAKRVQTIVRRAPNELGRSALFLGMGQLEDAPDYVVQELCQWANSERPLVMRTSAKKAKAALSKLQRQGDCPDQP